MLYQEALRYLDTFINFESKGVSPPGYIFKLERIKEFLSYIGNPQDSFKIIHVAGTKGKGSTVSFIAQILKEEGFKTGLYTSPHLQSVRERVRVLDKKSLMKQDDIVEGMIDEERFAASVMSLSKRIDSFCSRSGSLGRLSYFEIMTVLAFVYFKEEEVDFVVLETGLGGRLDATNAVSSLISVIAPISHDHEHLLGATLAEIAFEKAGIIKSGNVKTKKGSSVALSAPQKRDVRGVLRRRAKAQGSLLFEGGRDFLTKKLKTNLFSQDFFYRGLNNKSFFLTTKMLGAYQLINASLALASCEALSLYDIDIKRESMQRGILNTFWPGRLEIFKVKPFVILDGAHNEESALSLSAFLKREFKGYRRWLLFGACEDKNIKAMAERLNPMFDEVVLTRAAHQRAADPYRDVSPFFKNAKLQITGVVDEAIDLLNEKTGPDDVVVVAGSLFLVGEVRQKWQD